MKILKEFGFIFLFILVVLVLVSIRIYKRNYFALSVNDIHEITLDVERNLLAEDVSNLSDEDLLIDLREKEQYENSHIDGAIHIDLENLFQNENRGLFEENKRVILYSSKIGNSIKAKSLLNQLGYSNIYTLYLPANTDFNKEVNANSLLVDEVFKYKFQPDSTIALK